MAGACRVRSVAVMSYHRPRQLCHPRSDPKCEPEPLTKTQMDSILRMFREPDGYRDRAAGDERAMLAEDRRALGLAPIRPRR
jgi:hypothetical protein